MYFIDDTLQFIDFCMDWRFCVVHAAYYQILSVDKQHIVVILAKLLYQVFQIIRTNIIYNLGNDSELQVGQRPPDLLAWRLLILFPQLLQNIPRWFVFL